LKKTAIHHIFRSYPVLGLDNSKRTDKERGIIHLRDTTEIKSTNPNANFIMNKKALKMSMFYFIGFNISLIPNITYFIYYSCDNDYDDVTVYIIMLITALNSFFQSDSEIRMQILRNLSNH
jgi:hypothetical protein